MRWVDTTVGWVSITLTAFLHLKVYFNGCGAGSSTHKVAGAILFLLDVVALLIIYLMDTFWTTILVAVATACLQLLFIAGATLLLWYGQPPHVKSVMGGAAILAFITVMLVVSTDDYHFNCFVDTLLSLSAAIFVYVAFFTKMPSSMTAAATGPKDASFIHDFQEYDHDTHRRDIEHNTELSTLSTLEDQTTTEEEEEGGRTQV